MHKTNIPSKLCLTLLPCLDISFIEDVTSISQSCNTLFSSYVGDIVEVGEEVGEEVGLTNLIVVSGISNSISSRTKS